VFRPDRCNQDWHPATHGSFATNHAASKPADLIDLNGLPQILWPRHCVQDTPDADFVLELDRTRWSKVFPKGTDPEIDSYSGFFDNGRRNATGLRDYLRERDVTDVYIVGLATGYCVKFTALDARHLGFETFLIEDAARGVDLNPGDRRSRRQRDERDGYCGGHERKCRCSQARVSVLGTADICTIHRKARP